jgi:hypothetical protein
MTRESVLLFHSPYIKLKNDEIYCLNSELSNRLRSYYFEMIGHDHGARLFSRTMMYCSSADGWTINAEAAEIYGLTTLARGQAGGRSANVGRELQIAIEKKQISVFQMNVEYPNRFERSGSWSDNDLKEIPKNVVATMERENAWWIKDRKIYVRIYNTSRFEIVRVKFSLSEGSCDGKPIESDPILLFDISAIPLRQGVGSVYSGQLPDGLKGFVSSGNCGIIVDALGR